MGRESAATSLATPNRRTINNGRCDCPEHYEDGRSSFVQHPLNITRPRGAAVKNKRESRHRTSKSRPRAPPPRRAAIWLNNTGKNLSEHSAFPLACSGETGRSPSPPPSLSPPRGSGSACRPQGQQASRFTALRYANTPGQQGGKKISNNRKR